MKIGALIFLGLILAGIATALTAWQNVPKSGNVTLSAPGGVLLSAPSGRVTMIALGETEYVPCKMMAPILVEVREEYRGRADIAFIDVGKDPDQAIQFRIKAIPTQIFFDVHGNEIFRHVGFLDKRNIVSVLEQMGVARRG